MSTPQRTRLIQIVHVRAKQIGLRDDARADLQHHLTGHRSCRDMAVRDLAKVADELRHRLHARQPVDASRPVENTDGMRRRALALAASIGANEAYVDAIAQRQARVAFRDATTSQLRGVIAALYRRSQKIKPTTPTHVDLNIRQGTVYGPWMRIHRGDCVRVLQKLAAASFDAVVTDPPYGIGILGREWDTLHHAPAARPRHQLAWTIEWASALLRVLKPGASLLVCMSPRTSHRVVSGIEDAGFEIRDVLL